MIPKTEKIPQLLNQISDKEKAFQGNHNFNDQNERGNSFNELRRKSDL